jgi:hypothetical protein
MKSEHVRNLFAPVAKLISRLAICAFLFTPASPLLADSAQLPLGEERAKLDIGAFLIDVGTGASLTFSEADGGQEIDFEDDLGLTSSKSVFRIDGYWRFAPRHRLNLAYYAFNRTADTRLQTEIRWEELVLPIGSDVTTEVKWELIPVSYAYSFYKNRKWEIAGSIGIHWMNMSASINSETSVGGSIVIRRREESATSGPLPVLGIHLDYQPATKWLVGAKVQYFDTDYEEYDGSIFDAGVYAEYLINRNWSVGVGYNYFYIHVDVDEDDWDGNLEYEYSGIQVYGSYRF